MEGDFEGKESVDDCETLMEKLRSQKQVCKMQLTKLYSRLLRLMSGEVTDVEELLTVPEASGGFNRYLSIEGRRAKCETYRS